METMLLGVWAHTPKDTFRHLHRNSARNGYATVGTLVSVHAVHRRGCQRLSKVLLKIVEAK